MSEIDTDAILSDIYGQQLHVHVDLHALSTAHRRQHEAYAACTVYPSPLTSTPMWTMLAAMIGARRFLEVGCGLGYTAAVMAEVGSVQALVDTVERDPLHAEIAERELTRRGLGDRVRVLRGDATDILQHLQEPYDIVFLDTDWGHYPEWLPDLTRLTRRGGLLVSGNLFSLLADWGQELPQKEAIREYLTSLVRDPRFRTWIIAELWHALSYRIA